MDSTHALGLMALGIPCAYLAAAALANSALAVKIARFATIASLALSAALAPFLFTLGGATDAFSIVRLDVVTGVMLGLVSFIGFVLVRFSGRYLDGDPGIARYIRWLMATLTAVSLLVTSSHLLVLGAAWVGTSVALHQLLTFYSERPRALIAAHKKFLVSRVADLALLGGVAIVGTLAGSFQLADVHAWALSVERLPLAAEFACVLFVAGASLKCAQLPFHGWLTQVMEAPTPVSALLHAGVVNIGGFLMIRLSPLMAQAEFAQTLLVLIGTTTAVLAALVMTTRVSVKVSLAWSTCAQMGFMLVQCGLGAYHLALLHLVAHSLYKAHAFLSTGSTVDRWSVKSLLPEGPRESALSYVLATPLAAIMVYGTASIFGVSVTSEPAIVALGFVLTLAVASLLARVTTPRESWVAASIGLAVMTLYFTWNAAFAGALGEASHGVVSFARLAIVLVGFGALFAVQSALRLAPEGRLARRVYPLLFAGLFLDELFTRVTFRVWPARLPTRSRTAAIPNLETQEA